MKAVFNPNGYVPKGQFDFFGPFVNSHITKFSEKDLVSDPDLLPDEPLDTEHGETCPYTESLEELRKLIVEYSWTRPVETVWHHCTGTRINAKVSAIVNYWENVRGWKNPGCHLIVDYGGNWTWLQPFNLPSNGVRGYNLKGLHICYIGGLDKNGNPTDTRSEKQKIFMETVPKFFKELHPHLTERGHREVSNKSCPCYDVN